MSSELLKKSQSRPISLTALIDVVFILLMFFMLTTSFSIWKKIEFNSASGASEITSDLLLIRVDAKGALSQFSDATDIAIDDLVNQALASSDPVVLLPAGDTRYQVLLQVLSQLELGGLDRVEIGPSYQSDAKGLATP